MGKKYNDKVIKSLLHPSMEALHKEWTLNSFKYDDEATELLTDSFKKIYPHGYERAEVSNLISKFINDTTQFSCKFNRLYLIKQLSYKLLNSSYSESTVSFNHYFDWIGITNKISEELLTETIKGMNENLKSSKYLMNLPHDFYSLNSILDDSNVSKTEQHMHINASSLNFNMSGLSSIYSVPNYIRVKSLQAPLLLVLALWIVNRYAYVHCCTI